MLCIPIKGPTLTEVHQQIEAASTLADLVELRLDLFEKFTLSELESLKAKYAIPMIFTLRTASQGGGFTKSEEVRLKTLAELVALKPDYLDIEFGTSLTSLRKILDCHAEIKLIVSHHNFLETPQNLSAIYQEMRKIPAWGYKLVTTPYGAIDCLRQLIWSKKVAGNIISMCMGPYGAISRILAPIVGNPITYASLEENLQTASGQVPALELIERYHFRTLNPCTAIFALIGDPVTHSISDKTHNNFFKTLGLDAIYLKILIKKHELQEFLQLAKELPVTGVSVTTPLKESVLSYIDSAAEPHIKAVNTLALQNGHWMGSNTDGYGALNAIAAKELVANKRLVIIGAGGAAIAIAYEAIKRGALVTIVNRDESRARQVAASLNIQSFGLNQMPLCAKQGYDILINCTPAEMPIAEADILPKTIVMDIKTKPKHTQFLLAASKKGCHLIYGYQMFIEQALGQFQTWLQDDFCLNSARRILEETALEVL